MSPGGKIFLTLAAAGGVLGVLAIAGSKSAHAATPAKPKKPGSETPPDFVVPNTSIVPQGTPLEPSVAPVPATPAPAVKPPAVQPLPQGAVSLPNPLGGPPLGMWDPTSGNVYGPLGVIIGKFDPKTGIFTTPSGATLHVPGFGQSSPSVVPASLPAPTAAPGPLPAPAATPAPVAVPAPLPAPAAAPAPMPAPAATLPPVSIQIPGPLASSIPLPVPLSVPIPAAVPVSTISSDTAQMVAALLDAESQSGWNRVDPSVTAWQKARPPMKVDGKFGTKSALLVAQELGTIPLVRFWPVGSQKDQALNEYRAALIALSNSTTDQIRAKQLRISAQREQALAFSNKGPLPALPAGSVISLARVA